MGSPHCKYRLSWWKWWWCAKQEVPSWSFYHRDRLVVTNLHNIVFCINFNCLFHELTCTHYFICIYVTISVKKGGNLLINLTAFSNFVGTQLFIFILYRHEISYSMFIPHLMGYNVQVTEHIYSCLLLRNDLLSEGAHIPCFCRPGDLICKKWYGPRFPNHST